jgi:hypothetical protein
VSRIVFVESFDAIDDDHLGDGRWQNWSSGILVDAAYGRTGRGIRISGAGTWEISYGIPGTDRGVPTICGVAVKSDLTASEKVFGFYGRGGTPQFMQMRVEADGSVSAWALPAGVPIVRGYSDSGLITPNNWHYIEVAAWQGTDTTSNDGYMTIMVDGVEVLDVTGDFYAGPPDNEIAVIGLKMNGNAPLLMYDDLYIAQAVVFEPWFQGDLYIEAYFPNGTGNANELDTEAGAGGVNNYTHVDEGRVVEDVDYVESSTLDEKDLYAFEDTANTDAILGVQVNARARKIGTPVRKLALMARGGTPAAEEQGSDINLPGSVGGVDEAWAFFSEVMPADPNDEDWTQSSYNAAQFGVKVR